MRFLQLFKKLADRFAGDRKGNIALAFSLAILPLSMGVGIAIDYSNLTAKKTQLQMIADQSALSAARELRLANATQSTILQVAQNYVDANGAGLAIGVSGALSTDKTQVTLNLSETVGTHVMKLFGKGSVALAATSTAKIIGGAPICVVGIEKFSLFSIGLDKNAKLDARNCAVYSNSISPIGLYARDASVLQSMFTCSAGGKDILGKGTYIPQPQLDCPAIPDPLANRPSPAIGACTATNLVISGGSTTLNPGTYCGGIKITNAANVILSPGIFIIKDGPLVVSTGASMTGGAAGFYFIGKGAALSFDPTSIISLTAPTTGLLAGILFFEDKSTPIDQMHEILSNNAHNLLGTIYLPRGILHIGSNSPVADQSAFTIVVVRIFWLSEGPTMVMNTNYGGTSVPVPQGLGDTGQKTVLVK